MNYQSVSFKGTKLKMLTSAVALALTTSIVSAKDVVDYERADEAQKQTSQQAFDNDVAILAREKGVDKAAIAQAIKFQGEFELVAKDIVKKFPHKVSRIWVEPAPSQMAHIQFVGRVPNVQLPANVSVKGGGRFSLQENMQRAEHIADVLKKAGKRNFMTYFDARTGKVKVEMAMPSPSKGPNKAQVVEILQRNAKRDQDMPRGLQSITEGDIELDVIQSDEEIYTLEHSRGGNWLRDDGFRECTSGWAVSGPNGDGIVTAAHCTGLNQFEESTSSIYSMTWRSQERGNGDAEYHTTTHIEPAEFWASSSALRDVNSIKSTFFMSQGESVCEYGRSSNTRTCNHQVEAKNVTVTFTDGVTVSNLVKVSGDNSIGGDSGGGWSWGTKAWGVHSGSNGSSSFFTPVQRVQTELNVTIKKK